MMDMAPRGMDGFRPVRPANQPPRPAAQPVQPAAAQPPSPAQPNRPAGPPAGYQPPQAPSAAAPAVTPAPSAKGGGWKVVLQFALGLLVIAAVAGAIVWLYLKYYQP